MNKIEQFKDELEYIKDSTIREFAEKAIEDLPDYFFEIPSSSTGKYHPKYGLGEGGLLRHTRSAIRIAIELFRMAMFNYFGDEGKDLILASLMVHDGRKLGHTKGKHTVAEHPLLQTFSMKKNKNINNILTKEQFDIICNNINTHMGSWNFSHKGKKEVLPRPSNKMQSFVHLCDYLASRRCLEMNFDVELSNK